jgi:hypothetical protein
MNNVVFVKVPEPKCDTIHLSGDKQILYKMDWVERRYKLISVGCWMMSEVNFNVPKLAERGEQHGERCVNVVCA